MFGEYFSAASRGLDEPERKRVGHHVQQHEISQAVEQIHGEPSRIITGFDHIVDAKEELRAVPGGKRFNGGVDKHIISDAEQWNGQVIGEAIGASTSEQLVEHGQGIAGRAAASADNQRKHGIFNVNTLGLARTFQQPAHRHGREQAEWIMVGAGTDGPYDLFRLRGGKDKDKVLRRLLHNLQKRIRTLGGDHVRLVDDKHAVAGIGGGEKGAVSKLAHIVNAVVARRIQLGHIQVSGTPGGQATAGITHPAWGGGRSLFAIQRARQDARRGGFAAAARSGKQIRMVDTAGVQRHRKRAGDVLLAYNLTKRCGTVLAI